MRPFFEIDMPKSNHNLPPDERPSKSHRKREMLALQKLGEILVELPISQLQKIPLNGQLADAIHTARSLTSHEAKRRQMQYIGRLMRDTDPKPIEEALAKVKVKDQQIKAQFHQVERWRDILIAEGDDQLQAFLGKFPETDRQQLRQLIRNAQQKKKGADTELFRYLRHLIEKNP